MTRALGKKVLVARSRRDVKGHHARITVALLSRPPKSHMASRKEERVVTDLRVRLEGGEGRVHNVSASGIYFVTEVPLTVGQPVDLKLEFHDLPSGALEVTCTARVVRIEPHGDAARGVAAAISSFEFRRL